LPHVWLNDGAAMQDRIGYGAGYTLARFSDGRGEGLGLDQAFNALGAPFRILDIDDPHAREIYGYELLLLRPDLHIVWRGNAPPEHPELLAAIATGYRSISMTSHKSVSSS
jgi:hypothetical protein